MSKGNPLLALRLSRGQQDALRAQAAESELTLSDFVRMILADHIAGQMHEEVPDAQSRPQKNVRKRPRKSSRPVRLRGAIATLEDLRADYEDWQTNQLENAEDSATAEKLETAIEALETAIDALDGLDLPLGFGRD